MRLQEPSLSAEPPSAGASSSDAPASQRGSTRRRRLLWLAGVFLALLLLVLTPPLVNANRYHRQIADTMSASLGRPVHLDNVSLHLLPVPGFTLQNLVVSEDPAFGSEPTVRANTVEATLRLSSLWHRPVEFSTIRFIEPSVNLVRNGAGRWNLADVLLRTSQVKVAPTDQRRHGPAPRFPYIEATGGRVNVKFGVEKLPFSLTEADFALWLPSPERWQVRLTGHPARTDASITDPGIVRVEGELRRGVSEGAVPLDLRASWHDAPLGEASRMLTGDDLGWRGTLNVDTSLAGTLGTARLATKFTLGGLRRAEFIPGQPLDLQVTCTADAAVDRATMADVLCTLPVGAPEPMTLHAATLDLQHPTATEATLVAGAIPVRRALLWAALYSARIPTDLRPMGSIDVNLARSRQQLATPGVQRSRASRPQPQPSATPPVAADGLAWSGHVQLTLPPTQEATDSEITKDSEGTKGTEGSKPSEGIKGSEGPAFGAGAATNTLLWTVEPNRDATEGARSQLRLLPTAVQLGPESAATIGGTISRSGYTLDIKGTTSSAALLFPARFLPQLGDGLDAVLPPAGTAAQPVRVDFTCVRSWTSPQICTGSLPANGTKSLSSGSASVAGPGQPAPRQHSPRRRTARTARLPPR